MRADRKRLILDGLLAGVIGYAVVVAFFIVLNLAQGRSPFHTAALLGSAVFGGLRDPGLLVLEPGMVLAFNGVHIVAFMLVGFFGAWLVYEAELHPQLWYLAFFLFLVGGVVGYAAVLATSLVVGHVLTPWHGVVANLLAALGMAAYLVASHRGLIRVIRESPGRLGTVD